MLGGGKITLDAQDQAFVLTELEALDGTFMMHFSSKVYFMTETEEWTEMWGQYVKALEQHVNLVAQ